MLQQLAAVPSQTQTLEIVFDVGWQHGFDGLSATPEVSKEASYSIRIVLGSAPAVALFSEVFLEQSEPRSKLRFRSGHDDLLG